MVLFALPASAYCNETQQVIYNTNTSNHTINITRTCTPEYNNDSFFNIIIVLLVFLILLFIAFIYFQKDIVRVIIGTIISLVLLYITRFSAWFITITNPEQVTLIASVNRIYVFSVYLFKALIWIGIFFAIIMGLRMLVGAGKTKLDNDDDEDKE